MVPNTLLDRMICTTLAFCTQSAMLAQTTPSVTPPRIENQWEPLFVGYSSEPGMDYGGRAFAALESAGSRLIGDINQIGSRHPTVRLAWELPLAGFFTMVNHEIMGHGSRARGFGLHPKYGLAHTGIGSEPHTGEESALQCTGGVEAGSVMAHRVLFSMLEPEGSDGPKLPLALFSKLELTVYVAKTHQPKDQRFIDQWHGNDIADYLASRQVQRQGIDPASPAGMAYRPDLSDPMLEKNWRAARAAALWNLLDPSLVAATVAYTREHILNGRVRVHAPVWKITDGLGLTVGTRAALNPREVSRFLDLYATTRWGVASVYVRRLDSSVDKTWGGGAVVNARVARVTMLGFGADLWKEPVALEHLPGASGWNVSTEVNSQFSRHWGFAVKIGTKSRGSFPGLPLKEGFYAWLGGTASW